MGSAGLLEKAITLMYSTVTPSLNSFIYTMKNKGLKASLKNYFHLKTLALERNSVILERKQEKEDFIYASLDY